MASKIVYGAFRAEEPFLRATREARLAGHKIYDTYTPYAVHGLEEAMGTPRTRLGIVCFWLGVLGMTAGLGFQWWVGAFSWPLNIGGKTYSAIPALIPVTFEMTILFAAIGTVLAFLIRARLWPGREAVLIHGGITDDRFILALKKKSKSEGGSEATIAFLEEQGAEDIAETEAPA